MINFFRALTRSFFSRRCAAFFIFLQCLAPMAQAADNEQEILNQLYREIMGSAPAGKSIRTDSMRAVDKTITRDPGITPAPEKTTDVVSDQLQKEIEKIVNDAKIRHSNAVKFMQDAK